MPTNQVQDIVVSVTVQPTGGHSPIVEIDDVIIKGAGTLLESIFGGQATYSLELTAGEELRPLSKGELVHIHGVRNGRKFVLDTPLATVSAKKPWGFTGTSGKTGP
jgi:hypothetical protein